MSAPRQHEGTGTAASDPAALAPPPEQAVPAADAGASPKGRQPAIARRTRVSTAFAASCAGVLLLVLLLVFMLENTENVRIHFLGAGGHIALGLALLVAAVGGALLTGILGGARVLQLRHAARRRLPKG